MTAVHIVSTAISSASGKAAPTDDAASAEQTPFDALLGAQMDSDSALPASVIDVEAAPASADLKDLQAVDPAALGLAPIAPPTDTPRAVTPDTVSNTELVATSTAEAPKATTGHREPRVAPQTNTRDVAQSLQAKDDSAAPLPTAAKLTATPQFDLQTLAPVDASAQAAPVHALQGMERAGQPAAFTLQQPVGSERWNNELGQTVNLLVRAEQHSATLHVTPPDLGPIDVHIDMAGDQASVSFTVQNTDTRNALESALPRLRDMLAEGGIALGNAHVNQQQSGEQRGEQSSTQRQGGGGSAPLSGASLGAAAVRGRIGLVDTFA